MSPTLDALLGSWPFDPWLVAALVFAATIYVRGWLVLRRRDPAPLVGRSTRGLPGRAGGCLRGAGLSDRAVRGAGCFRST